MHTLNIYNQHVRLGDKLKYYFTIKLFVSASNLILSYINFAESKDYYDNKVETKLNYRTV